MELNREQIIKALEEQGVLSHFSCDSDTVNALLDYIIDLENINRRWDKIAGDLSERLARRREQVKKLTEENERLRATKYYMHSDGRIEMIPTVESVKADTVRKMQERLKADAVTIQDHTGKLGVVVGVGNIDDVAREMLEGENGY